MTEWRPISEADPKNGDMALIIADQDNGSGEVYELGPQLCEWQEDEGFPGWWVQMLRGSYYGLGLDGEPRLWMPVPAVPQKTD